MGSEKKSKHIRSKGICRTTDIFIHMQTFNYHTLYCGVVSFDGKNSVHISQIALLPLISKENKLFFPVLDKRKNNKKY